MVCVRKKDSAIRIYANLGQINAITCADEYTASDMRATLDQAAGTKYITGLDLQQALPHVELNEQNLQYTVFNTPFGLFEHTVLHYRARKSLKCFQRLADTAGR